MKFSQFFQYFTYLRGHFFLLIFTNYMFSMDNPLYTISYPLKAPTDLKNNSDLSFRICSSKFFACCFTSMNSILLSSSSSATMSISFSPFRSCQ